MPDVLSTSVSALLAFQRALDVTSNNVSNSSTPGYSVERVNLTPQPAQQTSSGYIGSGVQVASVTRSYDELLAGQVRSSQSSYSNFDTFSTEAARVDNMLSASDTGLMDSLQSFVNALQSASTSASSTAQRQALLSQAQALAQQLRSYDSQLGQFSSGVESQISRDVAQVSTLADNIAALNRQIAGIEAGGQQTPNTLLDQRDHLVDQLSQYVSVQTAVQSDGQMNVYVGSGQALVVGSTAEKLDTVPDAYDASHSKIVLTTGPVDTDITTEINGGSLGGLLAVRSQVLDPTRNAIGQFSVSLATLVNQQQQAGLDLTGALGQPMFALGGVQILPDSGNSGSGALSVTRDPQNLAALTTDDYQMRLSGGSWQLLDTTTGQAVAMSGSGTSADPFKAAGLSIVVSGTAADDDSFMVRPTAAATAGLSVLLTSPGQIAAAAALTTAAGTANTGNATISAASVTDPSDSQLLHNATIQFTSATQYTVDGGPPQTYTSGSPIEANGWSVSISGAPAAGDTFTVGANTGASGDNRNLLAMVDALSSNALAGGTTSLSGAANNLISQIGVATQQAQSNASAQKAANQSAVQARSNLSGVNLDEEAANLVRYQQAYQAAAQMIQASNTMFNSLISAIANG